MINARAETLLEKPSFKLLVAMRRRLVPADGL
jgi:putative SOS response-associated peptidase YedK